MMFLDWLVSIARSLMLRSLIQNDPFYRFQSLDELRIAASMGVEIDANQATIDDWLRLPGLSIHQARILEQLSQSGVQFLSIEDIAAALGLPIQRIKPFEPILKFCFYDPESIVQIQRINLNKASVNELTKIPTMRPVLARAIVHNRNSNGAYKDLVEFQQRLSLSGEAIADLMHYLSF